MTTQHVTIDVLNADTGLQSDKGAHTRRIEDAGLADHALRWQFASFHGQVSHGIQRVGQDDKYRIGRVLERTFDRLANDFCVGCQQVFAAHAGFAGQAGRDNDDVRILGVLVTV